MPHRSTVSTRTPRPAKLAASATGLLLVALALAGCGSTQLPKAGDCIEETATVSSSAPTTVDCKSSEAVSKVVEVDDDPPDHAGQDSIGADLCAGHDGGEVYVMTETDRKKNKKTKKTKTETENDWAACLVKA